MPEQLIHDGRLDKQKAAEALREFLEQIVRAGGFQLTVTVRTAVADAASDAEVIADIDGMDKELLLERGAEVLRAMEHLAFRALRLEPAFHEKIHVDCGGYRALRFEELRMTARVAAERVRAPHAEGNARDSHGKRRHGRRKTSGDSSRGEQAGSLAKNTAAQAQLCLQRIP